VTEQAVGVSGGAIIAVILAGVVALFVINILKGKPGMALAGILIHVTWYVGAIRLAKPNSWWARRYYVGENGDKLQRAIVRHGEPAPSSFAGSGIIHEGWLAGTVPKDEGVPVQRRNPETGKWVVVYVPKANTTTGPAHDSPSAAETEPVMALASSSLEIVDDDKRKFCERCGQSLRSTTRFCGACGQPVPGRVETL
jgi:hypothetical protein